MGNEVHALRKAIQSHYSVGVTARMEQQQEPDLSLDIVKSLIHQHLHDPTIKALFLQFLDDPTPTDAATELFQRAVCGGTFFTSIYTCTAAW